MIFGRNIHVFQSVRCTNINDRDIIKIRYTHPHNNSNDKAKITNLLTPIIHSPIVSFFGISRPETEIYFSPIIFYVIFKIRNKWIIIVLHFFDFRIKFIIYFLILYFLQL